MQLLFQVGQPVCNHINKLLQLLFQSIWKQGICQEISHSSARERCVRTETDLSVTWWKKEQITHQIRAAQQSTFLLKEPGELRNEAGCSVVAVIGRKRWYFTFKLLLHQ